MLNITVSGITQTKQALDSKIRRLLERVSADVLSVARANTPIRLGKARAGWKRKKLGKEYSVSNRVVYIGKLEEGSSKQAPRGILKPTVDEITRRKY
jgi:hypothetical protein